jgi:hypothetical protein
VPLGKNGFCVLNDTRARVRRGTGNGSHCYSLSIYISKFLRCILLRFGLEQSEIRDPHVVPGLSGKVRSGVFDTWQLECLTSPESI